MSLPVIKIVEPTLNGIAAYIPTLPDISSPAPNWVTSGLGADYSNAGAITPDCRLFAMMQGGYNCDDESVIGITARVAVPKLVKYEVVRIFTVDATDPDNPVITDAVIGPKTYIDNYGRLHVDPSNMVTLMTDDDTGMALGGYWQIRATLYYIDTNTGDIASQTVDGYAIMMFGGYSYTPVRGQDGYYTGNFSTLEDWYALGLAPVPLATPAPGLNIDWEIPNYPDNG